MVKLPEFKATLTTTGNSKAIIIPAKMRDDYGIKDETEYWVEMKLRKADEANE